MPKSYECYKCQKKFDQKSHYDTHLSRTRTCQKCDSNFKTNYAYIDGTPIHITKYLEKYSKKEKKIKCNKGHNLILVNGPHRISHFRHKNGGDVGGQPMTNWHSEWQRLFPVTEIWFRKIDGQIKDRRADIVIENHNTIIEIEHSGKTEEEIIIKHNDYKLHGYDIIWIIDGNTPDIKLEKLSTGQFLIIFNNSWKFISFIHNYNFILLDISGKIFKIPVKKVKVNMIKLKEYKSIECVVSKLQSNPKQIWDLWVDDNSCESNLIIWQAGAGNGKTYGLWKEVISNPDKDTFIILATKHSEKTVILNELKEQQERNEYHIVENIYEDIDGFPEEGEEPRQYILTFTHKISGREITIIIGTVSSFYFNITTINRNSSDPFSSLVPNFLIEGATKVNLNTGGFKFAGDWRYLNKKTQIWFDEAQDLPKDHLQSIVKLMLSYNVDVGVIGDKLQSLNHEENIFTIFNIEIPNITITRPIAENNNRRIEVQGLTPEINKVVKYKEHGLNEISTEYEDELDVVENPFELLIFNKIVLSNDKSGENIKNVELLCNEIVQKIQKEIKENNYLPQDFIIISPILSGRIELIELKSKLEQMWIELFDDINYVENISDDHFKNNNHNTLERPVEYVQFHKSSNGNAINLSESVKKTRIVSTVTSKGDGRNVAICLNITERALKLVSDNKIGLRYESHLNVPITRAKRKVYFQLTENGDDIHKRFKSKDYIYITPYINKNININKLMDYIDDYKIEEILTTNKIYKEEEEGEEEKTDIPKIDFTDHCSRYAVYKTLLHFHLNKKLRGHCAKAYDKLIKEIPIGEPEKVRNYWANLNIESINHSPPEDLEYIPLINYDNKYYEGFAERIKERMNKIKKKLESYDYTKDDFKSLKLKECDYLCLSYMININRYKKWTPFNINELYSIINRIQNNEKKIQHFYKNIKPVEKICNELIVTIEHKYGKLKWNIEHSISYEGNTDDFKIQKNESVIIGNNDNYVVDVIMKTTFNELNFFSIMKEILLNRFIIYKPLDKTERSKNKERFSNKKIITYVLILKTNNYKEFNWDWDQCHNMKELIKQGLISYFSSFHTELYYYINKICLNWSYYKKTYNIKTGPFIHIINKLREMGNPLPYIIKFVEQLEDGWSINGPDTKNIIENEDIFMERINKVLKKNINRFLDDEDDDFDF